MSSSKIRPKRYKIGEVAEISNVSKTTLNHWITSHLLRPLGKSEGGHRQFDEEVFDRIETIKKAQKGGKSLEQIKKDQGWN